MEKIPNQQDRNSARCSSFLESNPKNPVQTLLSTCREELNFYRFSRSELGPFATGLVIKRN